MITRTSNNQKDEKKKTKGSGRGSWRRELRCSVQRAGDTDFTLSVSSSLWSKLGDLTLFQPLGCTEEDPEAQGW